MTINAWIIATGPAVATLLDHARTVATTVTVVAVGTDPAVFTTADRVLPVPVPEGLPVEAAAPQVAAAVTADGDDLVLAADRPADRVLAAAVAAHLAAPLLTGVLGVTTDGIDVGRLGGLVVETVSPGGGPLVLVADSGAALAPTETHAAAPAAPGTAVTPLAATVLGVSEPTGSPTVDLAAARRVVAVGRGFAAAEDLELARDLARVLDAELGCSRPLAEGTGWLPTATYIGVSGQKVAPDLYLAIGISGQLQHTVGARAARTVVVVNKDPQAPYFAEADYGVVGDLYTVLPELTRALGG